MMPINSSNCTLTAVAYSRVGQGWETLWRLTLDLLAYRSGNDKVWIYASGILARVASLVRC